MSFLLHANESALKMFRGYFMFSHQGAANTMGSFTERGNKFEVALLVPDVTDELIPPDSMTLLVLIKRRQPLLVPVGHLRLLLHNYSCCARSVVTHKYHKGFMRSESKCHRGALLPVLMI